MRIITEPHQPQTHNVGLPQPRQQHKEITKIGHPQKYLILLRQSLPQTKSTTNHTQTAQFLIFMITYALILIYCCS